MLGFVILGRELFNGQPLCYYLKPKRVRSCHPRLQLFSFYFLRKMSPFTITNHQSPITKNKVKEMAGATATRVIIWDTFFKSKSK